MAVAFGSLLTSGGTATTSAITTASITPTVGRLTIFTFFFRSNTNAGITVTGTNGWNVTWNQISVTNYAGTEQQIWWAYPSSGTAGTITAGTASGANDALWAVQTFSGVDTTAPIVQSNYANGSSTSLSVTLGSAIGANNAVFGYGYRSSAVTFTPGSGFTEIVDTSGSINRTISTEYDLSSPSTTITQTISVTGSWAIMGLELQVYVPPATSSDGNFFQLF